MSSKTVALWAGLRRCTGSLTIHGIRVITWYLLDQFASLLELLRRDFAGKYFLHNLVFYKGGQRYGREYFTTLDEFIARVPFQLVARMEATATDMDTIE